MLAILHHSKCSLNADVLKSARIPSNRKDKVITLSMDLAHAANPTLCIMCAFIWLTGVCLPARNRRSYRKNEVIEENKALLKEKYAAAKGLGKQVGLHACNRVTATPSLLERHVCPGRSVCNVCPATLYAKLHPQASGPQKGPFLSFSRCMPR